jgi:hypothetical protein
LPRSAQAAPAASAAVHAARLRAQLLAGRPARTPEDVAERLLAIQGQDPRGARLTVRARTRRLTAADVDAALTERRSLVITWLNRGTLHLVRSEDYPWLQALTTPPLLRNIPRWLAKEGVSPAAAERGVAAVVNAIAADGPLTREQLRERIASARVRTEGQALIYILMLACLRGLTVRGPMAGANHAYALVGDWLPRPPKLDRERSLAELARRYLAGHGPADDRDLARWAGIPLRDARAGLAAIAAELDELPGGLVDIRRSRRSGSAAPPRLLGAFEPLLLGWCSRAAVTGRHQGLVTVNGIFRPFALVGGRAVATWSTRGGEVALSPFARISGADAQALNADAEDVVRFLAPRAS